ncbi:MAG TPA: methylmalonyl-CoA mutase family protein [Thermodesulfobacteriota bacterium]|nr:methylmalonyl-CoA mutase family protein [Thermodesulfobacteriota bacterium]
MFDPKKIEEMRNQAQEWNNKVDKTLAKNPERKKNFQTTSGIAVKRVFSPEDIAGLDYRKDLNLPGEFPYTRGIQPTMFRGRFWTMRQYAGFGTAEDTNRRYRYLLEQGQTGLSVAFDLPTQIGYDSDHPLAQGEVGKVGVAIDSVKDMEVLFNQIPLDKVSTSMTINAPAALLLAMYIAVGEEQGVVAAKLNGTIQNDILKEYSSRGTYIFPPKPSMRIITNTFEYCTREVPNWNTISISGYHMREAGCTAVQEVAFTLSNGIAYVQAALQAGLDVDEFAPRLSFFFNAHLDFLEEVAKYRAARRLWSKIMKDRFKAQNPRSWMLRFHTQTAGSTLTAQQPSNNIIRVGWQALAAVLGGTQSLHTNSMDEALALPSEQSVQVALRTQQLIAYESGAGDTADPLGGSFYIEKLTDEIEKRAGDYMEKIDQMGGSVAAVERGYIQQEIQESAYRYQKEVESGDRVIVGVNRFQTKEPPLKGLLKVDPRVREVQVKRIAELKASRDSQQVKTSLAELKKTAQGEGNLMVPILNAVRARCTLGEICDTLRGVFGEYEPVAKI